MKIIDLEDRYYKIIKDIVNKYEKDFSFYAFGSRVKGKAKKYSDLDLAYEKHTDKSITKVSEEFDDSQLPITIDLVNLNEVEIEFQEHIRSHMIPL